MFDLRNLDILKSNIFSLSNEDCFIEREKFLFSREENDSPDCYANMIAELLDSVSTPISKNDIFAGNAVEGSSAEFSVCPSLKLKSKGHTNLDYAKLITVGYKGIIEEIRRSAENIGNNNAFEYLNNAEILVRSIDRYAKRYAEAAKIVGNERAYKALTKVPYEPAYDLYSALQSIWLVHMISSCYVGSRDYAFGYMDEYLYPYYLKEIENGTSEQDIRIMLAGFLIKANEICGRHPHNYKQKPVLSQSSKQYVLLDGGKVNELSYLILEAAKLNCMAQPTITVILSKNAPSSFKGSVFNAMSVLADKMHVYNCESLKSFLEKKGLPKEIVSRPALSACCTMDIYNHSVREEFFLPTVQTFCKTIFENEFSSKSELLAAFSKEIAKEAQAYIDETRDPGRNWARKTFVLDSLLLKGCNDACDYPPYATRYRVKNIFLPGIATLGDSLCALDTLVFSGDIPYSAFVSAVKTDFEGEKELLEKIAGIKKFGNDTKNDSYTAEIANVLIDAVESCSHRENEIVAPSFYSLERDNVWAADIPATPDGRRAGSPISENQSPTYGCDTEGVTALLCSTSKLPFSRTGAGGLNVTFTSRLEPKILEALVSSYFELGGLHIGISIVDKDILRDAMRHPERYASLTVRLYGFSEYFISLPEWQQLAVLNRTAY